MMVMVMVIDVESIIEGQSHVSQQVVLHSN